MHSLSADTKRRHVIRVKNLGDLTVVSDRHARLTDVSVFVFSPSHHL